MSRLGLVLGLGVLAAGALHFLRADVPDAGARRTTPAAPSGSTPRVPVPSVEDPGTSRPVHTKWTGVVQRLLSANEEERRDALRQVRELGPRGASVVPELADALVRGSSWDRGESELTGALIAIGEEGLPFLIEVLRDHPHEAIVDALVDVFASIGPASAPHLAKGLGAADAVLRRRAAMVLENASALAQLAVPQLARALRDDDPRVVQRAAAALGDVGAAAAPAVPALVDTFRTIGDDWPSLDTATEVAFAIGRIGASDDLAIASLRGALESRYIRLRSTAADALGKLRAVAAVPELAERLADPEETVRQSAAWALSQMGPASQAALPALLRVVDDPKERHSVRITALAAVGALGSRARQTASMLVRLMETAWGDLQVAAAQTLWQVAADLRGVPVLSAALTHARWHVRLRAARALGEIGVRARNAAPRLRALLEDPEPMVRDAARVALAEILK